MKTAFRSRSRSTASDDLAWLRNARNVLRAACETGLPSGEWPLRAAAMDKLTRALSRVQLVLFTAIEEARDGAGGTPDERQAESDWLGYH